MTMRALVRGVGGVELREVATPRELGADEVLLRVRMAGLCRTDCYVAEGRLGPSGGARILGHEIAADVVACGESVPEDILGARVSVDPRIRCGSCSECARGEACAGPGFLGVDVDGGFAEYVRVPASSLVQVPRTLDLRGAAYIEPVAATLAILGAGIRPEQRGLIVGKGRIAALAQAILRARGFSQIHAFDPENDPAPSPGAYDFAIENGVDRVGMSAIITALRRGGRVVLKSRRLEPLEIDLLALVPKELELVAAYYGSFTAAASLVAGGELALGSLWASARPLEAFATVFEEARRGEGRKLFFAVADAEMDAGGEMQTTVTELRACVGSSAPLA